MAKSFILIGKPCNVVKMDIVISHFLTPLKNLINFAQPNWGSPFSYYKVPVPPPQSGLQNVERKKRRIFCWKNSKVVYEFSHCAFPIRKPENRVYAIIFSEE